MPADYLRSPWSGQASFVFPPRSGWDRYTVAGKQINYVHLGKTFLYNALIAKCEAEGKTVLRCAATGIAATLLHGGSTLHSTFSIPLYLNGTEKAQTCRNEDQVRNADLIIIDEISMLSHKIFDYLDELLRNLSENSEKPFGNKCIVLGGDFHQLSPVTANRKRKAQVEASIRHHRLFCENFKVLQLTENMRVAEGETRYIFNFTDSV